MKQKSCETPFRAALERYVELLDIPQTGGKMIGKGRFIRQKTAPDLCGTIRGDGRSFVADAKTDGGKILYLSVAFKDREDQRKQIVNAGQVGAVAGLLVESTLTRRFYWLSWGFIEIAGKTGIVGWKFELGAALKDLGPTNQLPDVSRIFSLGDGKEKA